jgi:hypothetical protein
MGPALVGMAGGQIYGAISGYQSASGEQKQQDAETKRLRQEAAQTEAVTGFKQQRETAAGARELSSMEASAAAGGAVATSGAPLMAMAKQSAENELKVLMTGYEGSEQAKGLRYEADVSKWKARMMGMQKRNALIGSLLGAGGTALTGFSKMGGGAGGATGQAIGGANPSYVSSPDFESLSGQYGTFA